MSSPELCALPRLDIGMAWRRPRLRLKPLADRLDLYDEGAIRTRQIPALPCGEPSVA